MTSTPFKQFGIYEHVNASASCYMVVTNINKITSTLTDLSYYLITKTTSSTVSHIDTAIIYECDYHKWEQHLGELK